MIKTTMISKSAAILIRRRSSDQVVRNYNSHHLYNQYLQIHKGGQQQLPSLSSSWIVPMRRLTTTTTTKQSKTKLSIGRRRQKQQQKQQKCDQKQKRFQSNEASSTNNSTKVVSESIVEEPSFDTLKIVALGQAIPFMGFGFMDNAILIIAGDAIDTSLGVILGISTMCAAALGNIISDVAGILCGTAIEDFCSKVLKLPVADLTTAQRQLRSVRFASQFGCGTGIVIGCIIGMIPLYFIDHNKIQVLKREAQLETLFHDVVTEAKTLISAESTCLYLRVQKDDNDNNDNDNNNKQRKKKKKTHSTLPYQPTVDGDYLYAMYYELPENTNDESNNTVTSILKRKTLLPSKVSKKILNNDEKNGGSERLLPLGRGIVSRAILTGEPWNINDVHDEPDFLHDGGLIPTDAIKNVRNMIVVPVLDAQGNVIAVIEAMNKKKQNGSRNNNNFSNQDVQNLMALASHISVSLKSHYYDADGDSEEMRLRDTIQILKGQQIVGERNNSTTSDSTTTTTTTSTTITYSNNSNTIPTEPTNIPIQMKATRSSSNTTRTIPEATGVETEASNSGRRPLFPE